MDQTPERLATLAMLARFRQALHGVPPPRVGEPDGLLDMLLNPAFIAPNLGASADGPADQSMQYDDLPPLEDAEPTPTPLRSTAAADEDMPSLEDDVPSSAPVAPQPLASVNASSSPQHESGGVVSAAGGHSHIHITRSNEDVAPRITRTGASRARVTMSDFEDVGAESDGSLPSLQTVSDSSEEEDATSFSGSEPDWDDEEDSDVEDQENNFANLLERIDSAPPAPRIPYPTTRSFAIPIGPSYRDLLERARGVVSDLDSRLHTAPDWVTNLATSFTGIDNDPQRAETLLSAMEVVPDDLVRRYEKLRVGECEDVDGCAICRDELLSKATDVGIDSLHVAFSSALPFHPDMDCIVAFPCAGKHLFHKDCLSPWLARKTTCPSCRFDIDPLSLTLQTTGDDSDAGPSRSRLARVWQPPEVETLLEWLLAEEGAKVSGIPRQRPIVRMPEYPPLPPPPPLAAGAAPTRPARPLGTSFFDLFDATVPDWDFDADLSSLDVDAIRQRFLPADRLHQQIDNHLREVVQQRLQVPPRPPSAPPAPTSEGLPQPDRTIGPSPPPLSVFMHVPEHIGPPTDSPTTGTPPFSTDAELERWNRLERMREAMERRFFPDGAPWAAPRDTARTSQSPPSLSDDAAERLHDTPLVLTPPRNPLDVGVLNVHARPFVVPSPTSRTGSPLSSVDRPSVADTPTHPSRSYSSQVLRNLAELTRAGTRAREHLQMAPPPALVPPTGRSTPSHTVEPGAPRGEPTFTPQVPTPPSVPQNPDHNPVDDLD